MNTGPSVGEHTLRKAESVLDVLLAASRLRHVHTNGACLHAWIPCYTLTGARMSFSRCSNTCITGGHIAVHGVWRVWRDVCKAQLALNLRGIGACSCQQVAAEMHYNAEEVGKSVDACS
jgi:hypothetical protein